MAVAGERRFWVAAERVPVFRVIYPEAKFETAVAEIGTAPDSRGDAIFALVTGWMGHTGPITAAELAALLALPENEMEQALLRLEATGAILRGSFRVPGNASQAHVSGNGERRTATEFCERRLLARIHRLTIGRLRKEIEPVTEALFLRWLLRWQHVAPGSQLSGERGLLEVLRQLQGFEIPANAWERQVLARRVRDYDPAVLDQLCLTGAVGWGRLSPHPATLDTVTRDADDAGDGGRAENATSGNGAGRPTGRRRVIPTSVAPITFFVRDEAEWMLPHPAHPHTDERALSQSARDVLTLLRQRGASFFADIVRGTGKLKAEVETGSVGTGSCRSCYCRWI